MNENEEIAAKIRYLFENYRKPDGNRYSYSEVEKLTNKEVRNSWLSKLAKGKAGTPGLGVIKALTEFFGITPDFWFKDLSQWEYEQERGNGEDYQEFRSSVATRTSSMPGHAKQVINDMLESFEQLYGKKDKQ